MAVVAGSYAVEDTLNPKFVAESLESLTDELKTIIMDNPSWHAKAIDHVNELDHVRCLYLPQGDSFSPFREVISYG